MKTIFSLFIGIIFLLNCSAQTNRYKDTTAFADFTLNSNIQYGKNTNNTGKLQNLFFDLYEPKGDTLKKRPIIITAFGGGFISGTKTDNYMIDMGRMFSKMGYVVASIDYRIGIKSQFSVQDQAEAIYRGTQDFKSAIRYFVKHADSLGLDTSRFYIGGFSAGSISAIHATYWEQNEVFSIIDTNKLGGINTATGNQGYPLKIRAVINCFGAIADTSWIEKGNPSMVSLHGDKDNVVPYKSVSIFGYNLFGSWSLNERLNNLRTVSKLHTYYGKGHALTLPQDSLQMDTLVETIRDFLFKDMNSSVIITSIDKSQKLHKQNKPLSIINGKIIWKGENSENISFRLFDISGKTILQENFSGEFILPKNLINKGLYFIEVFQKSSGIHYVDKVYLNLN